MRKLIVAIVFSIFSAQTYATTSFFAVAFDNPLFILTGLSSTSFGAGMLFNILIIAENGETVINLNAPEAKDGLRTAVQKYYDGEPLSLEDESFLSIYAEARGVSVDRVIQLVKEDL